MKPLVIAAALILLLCAHAQAHTLHFTLGEYDDDTVELEGVFSTGAAAAGLKVRLYSRDNGAIIWEGTTDEFGTCVFERPASHYEVELDAGPGHKTRQVGI